MNAYMTALPDTCPKCARRPTHRVFSSFSSTTILDDFYCLTHALDRVRELNHEPTEQWQTMFHPDAQDLMPVITT